MNQTTVAIEVEGRTYNISVCYRAASKDLMLFLHGLGCSKDSFKDVWDHKDFKGCSLLTFDLIGFGHSAKPRDFGYTMEDHAAACNALIRHFPENRYHIVAHSMGGAIGLLLADHIRDSLVSFVNVEGNLIGEDCGLISRRTIGVSYEIFEKKMFPQYEKQFQGNASLPLALDMASPLAFYKSSESLVAWSESGRLLEKFKGLECKKAYFFGELSTGIMVVSMLDDIEKRRISDSGHFLMNENPDEFYTNLKTVF